MNRYSATWFELFLEPIPAAQTAREIAFIAGQLPRPAYATVLDLCCGQGRHARLLAQQGYQVTGVDRDRAALDAARRLGGPIEYLQADMRDLGALPGAFDAVVNLWQSLGYFDDATNLRIMRDINRKLSPGGRLILDIYHREFFERHQGPREFQQEGLAVVETKTMADKRLIVGLDYGPGREPETFDWRLYTPDEIREVAAQAGFEQLAACAGFDAATPPSPDSPRMQIVLQKRV